MLGSRCCPRWARLLAWSAAWLSFSCSGERFSSSASGGASASGGSTASGAAGGGGAGAGSAGETASGGAPDSAGSGGNGGSAVTPSCNCPTGRYCREGSTDCLECAALSRLRFAPPERLATLSDNGTGSGFPRVGATATDLVYVFNQTGLRYTTDSSTSAGSSVKATTPQDSGPLLLTEKISGNSVIGDGFAFFFDRLTSARHLYVSPWAEGTQGGVELPAPFNADKDDYSIAVATRPGGNNGPARAFWMSTRVDDTPRLYTAFLQEGTSEAEVGLRLAKDRPDPSGADKDLTCPTTDADLAPWVTRDGRTLLFSHTRVDANCAAVDAQKRDIYTTVLQVASGQPPVDAKDMIVPATPLSDVNGPEDDIQPAFSADMCDLYFASNRDGNFAVYRAHRQ